MSIKFFEADAAVLHPQDGDTWSVTGIPFRAAFGKESLAEGVSLIHEAFSGFPLPARSVVHG